MLLNEDLRPCRDQHGPPGRIERGRLLVEIAVIRLVVAQSDALTVQDPADGVQQVPLFVGAHRVVHWRASDERAGLPGRALSAHVALVVDGRHAAVAQPAVVVLAHVGHGRRHHVRLRVGQRLVQGAAAGGAAVGTVRGVDLHVDVVVRAERAGDGSPTRITVGVRGICISILWILIQRRLLLFAGVALLPVSCRDLSSVLHYGALVLLQMDHVFKELLGLHHLWRIVASSASLSSSRISISSCIDAIHFGSDCIEVAFVALVLVCQVFSLVEARQTGLFQRQTTLPRHLRPPPSRHQEEQDHSHYEDRGHAGNHGANMRRKL